MKNQRHFVLGLAGGLGTALLIAMGATGAAAQIDPASPTGSHLRVDPDKIAGEEAGDMQKGFGRCIFEVNHQTAVKILLNGDPMTVDLVAAHLHSSDISHALEHCLGQQAQGTDFNISASFSSQTLHSMLEEAAYLEINRTAPELSPVTAPAERRFVSLGTDLPKAQAMAAISDCLIVKDPKGADALLRTIPGGPGEHADAVALAPSLGSCLTAGQSLKLTPAVIRNLAADGLFTRYAQPALIASYRK